jgi:hypothetical protein
MRCLGLFTFLETRTARKSYEMIQTTYITLIELRLQLNRLCRSISWTIPRRGETTEKQDGKQVQGKYQTVPVRLVG